MDLSNPKVLQMGFEAPQSGSIYELSLEQIVHGNLYEVQLEDKHLSTFTDIQKPPILSNTEDGPIAHLDLIFISIQMLVSPVTA